MTLSSSETPHLTVVIPAFNEKRRISGTLENILSFLAAQPYAAEILIVDDGSTDGTAELIEGFCEESPGVRLIRNAHRGKAYAVLTGMLEARGDVALFSDADLSTPIEEVSRFLPYLESGSHSVVIGSREAPGAARYNEPPFRHLMGRVFTLLVHLITGQRFEDTQCGFKAFTREAAQEIFGRVQLYGPSSPIIQQSKVTGFDVELLFLARKLGLAIHEEPVRWYYSPGSKVDPLRDSLQNLADVVKVRLYDICGRYRA